MSEASIKIINGIEICQTQYPHPNITSGIHVNGPPSIWVRVPGGEWVTTHDKRMHIVRQWCEARGAEYVALLKEGGHYG